MPTLFGRRSSSSCFTRNEGTLPCKSLFPERSNTFKLVNSSSTCPVGNDPLKRLSFNSSRSRFMNLPNESGMDPVNKFLLTTRLVSWNRKGRVSLRLLPLPLALEFCLAWVLLVWMLVLLQRMEERFPVNWFPSRISSFKYSATTAPRGCKSPIKLFAPTWNDSNTGQHQEPKMSGKLPSSWLSCSDRTLSCFPPWISVVVEGEDPEKVQFFGLLVLLLLLFFVVFHHGKMGMDPVNWLPESWTTSKEGSVQSTVGGTVPCREFWDKSKLTREYKFCNSVGMEPVKPFWFNNTWVTRVWLLEEENDHDALVKHLIPYHVQGLFNDVGFNHPRVLTQLMGPTVVK